MNTALDPLASLGSDSEEDELKQLRAQAAEAAARRAAKQEAAENATEAQRLRQQVRDDVKLAELIEQHGALGEKIAAVETDLGLVVLQRPSTLKFRRFQDKGSFEYDAVATLVRPCVLYPDKAQFEAILDEQPGVLSRLAGEVVKLAGHRMEAVAGK